MRERDRRSIKRRESEFNQVHFGPRQSETPNKSLSSTSTSDIICHLATTLFIGKGGSEYHLVPSLSSTVDIEHSFGRISPRRQRGILHVTSQALDTPTPSFFTVAWRESELFESQVLNLFYTFRSSSTSTKSSFDQQLGIISTGWERANKGIQRYSQTWYVPTRFIVSSGFTVPSYPLSGSFTIPPVTSLYLDRHIGMFWTLAKANLIMSHESIPNLKGSIQGKGGFFVWPEECFITPCYLLPLTPPPPLCGCSVLDADLTGINTNRTRHISTPSHPGGACRLSRCLGRLIRALLPAWQCSYIC